MKNTMKFRQYDSSEIETVTQLFTQTFADSEGENEGKTIGKLANDLLTTTDSAELLCFVAEDDSNELDNKIAGAIIFTPLTLDDDTKVYLLSPVAVSTRVQKLGIGQKLIHYSLDTLKEQGVELAVTYGDPSYYSKVGFESITVEQIPAPFELSYPHGWIGQSLIGSEIRVASERSSCVKALAHPEYW
ncbi:GNAT family N-acetyltransferase [Vibrio sp. 10N.261.46.E12]|uniref:GNAT family N-acetyltransferase n=1 Tax=unclassified Vibrio TaxID=2614977 RepID=UPI000977DCC1|nr:MULTISPECIES: N-acetyltransferase [unclassified Vibrio]OMO34119.1 GNAT family N-acetyltransferase [Vibrio sp. 10N.261.45.E1]PMJ21145.1 GNAT family N-acetyltransferase [Vibrio sp. 10N.286.45.B6]PML84077.1 GNAT family N-acetyltransferase [Vibrio sp. 10N.261.49.E11]PMM67680.1 GNAT family N-acetyltransferase [Vibrio sp. 10N.261.46.F12]PMM86488.1 GNAT family N-acetyltransferase [Vibrio sp. 10N.261.46.E8]